MCLFDFKCAWYVTLVFQLKPIWHPHVKTGTISELIVLVTLILYNIYIWYVF